MTHSGFSCVRYCLCFLNLISWLVGCGMLGLGIWLHLAYSGYTTLLPSYAAFSADSLCIALGIIIFIVGFFGCCGSWFENKCLLITYFICVILIFLAELLVGMFGFIYRVHIGGVVKDELKMGISTKYSNDSKLVQVWRHIQFEFDCCGVSSVDDWFNINAWPDEKWVPWSCCRPDYRDRPLCGHSSNLHHFQDKGCYDMIHLWIMERLYIVGVVCMVLAFFQLFGLISSMLVICSTPRRRKIL
ncbi:TSPAN9 (predicted) [Pycnogonum litorale]